MLRQDVVAAAAEERFRVFPIETVDQGLSLLTGVPAGDPDADGNYPIDCVMALAEKTRALSLAPLRRALSPVARHGCKALKLWTSTDKSRLTALPDPISSANRRNPQSNSNTDRDSTRSPVLS
jgi:hypothetical protein